jgi:hypothetical protein
MSVRPKPPKRNLPHSADRETPPASHDGGATLLSQRAALILIAALVIGTGSGVLTYLAGARPAEAVLAGGGACAAAIVALNTLIA